MDYFAWHKEQLQWMRLLMHVFKIGVTRDHILKLRDIVARRDAEWRFKGQHGAKVVPIHQTKPLVQLYRSF